MANNQQTQTPPLAPQGAVVQPPVPFPGDASSILPQEAVVQIPVDNTPEPPVSLSDTFLLQSRFQSRTSVVQEAVVQGATVRRDCHR